MIGIKNPEVLMGMNKAEYKKKLKVAVNRFVRESQKTVGKTHSVNFAIIENFQLKDGNDYPVIILGFSTHWTRYIRELKKNKDNIIIGRASISTNNLYLTKKVQIKFTDTEANRLIKQNKYDKIVKSESLNLQIRDGEGDKKQKLATSIKDGVGLEEISTFLENYQLIDEEKEDLQMAHLKSIEKLVTAAKDPKNKSKINPGKLEEITNFVNEQRKEIEIELKEEAWEDYNNFAEDKSDMASDETESELEEMEFLHAKWFNLFHSKPFAMFEKEMEDLGLRIKAEISAYNDENEGIKNISSSESEETGAITAQMIKNKLDQLKGISKTNKPKRLKAIKDLQDSIDQYKSKNQTANPGLNKLADKLEKTMSEEIAQSHAKLMKIQSDYNYDVVQVSELKSFTAKEGEDFKTELNENKEVAEAWLEVYEDYGDSADLQLYKTMITEIENYLKAIPQVVEVTASLDQTLNDFEDQDDLDGRQEVYQQYEKILSQLEEAVQL
ncbi:MAG: hypothetical protein AAF502_01435 [Bacteroidota bacterium]